MLWLFAIIVGLLISLADIFLISGGKKVKTYIHICFRDTIFINLTAFFLMKNVLGVINIFQPSLHGPWYALEYAALILAIGVAFLFVLGICKKVFTFEKTEPNGKKRSRALCIIAIILFALGVAAFTGTLWGKEAFGDLAPDQILINLNSPLEGTDTGVYISAIEGPFLSTAFLTAFFCLIVLSPYKLVHNLHNKQTTVLPTLAIRIIALILAIAVFVGGFAFLINRFQLQKLYSAYLSASPYIEDNYADPKTTELTFPEEKRNLIHIYLESMETTYFSKELGGYFEENLMPELAALTDEGYNFSHQAEGFGGFRTSTGGNWSVASIANMGTGLPMKVPVSGNSYGAENNFLPGATALGDILNEQGYEQSVMFGAEAEFGGLSFYFKSHGNFNIRDYSGCIDMGWIPSDYHVWWGFEDDKLYELAKLEITRLYETGKPFHFVMETVDTHAPEGYLSPKAEKKFDTQYANVIHYSQAEAVKFVRWIQSQPFYENTTIVLIGDHLSMANSFFENVKGYERTGFNLVLNPAPNVTDVDDSRLHNRSWAVFDMFPTLLASLGVEIEGNRLGIGTNLFSDEQTLFERDGYEKVNKELENRSNFYNNNILVDWKNVGKTNEE